MAFTITKATPYQYCNAEFMKKIRNWDPKYVRPDFTNCVKVPSKIHNDFNYFKGSFNLYIDPETANPKYIVDVDKIGRHNL